MFLNEKVITGRTSIIAIAWHMKSNNEEVLKIDFE